MYLYPLEGTCVVVREYMFQFLPEKKPFCVFAGKGKPHGVFALSKIFIIIALMFVIHGICKSL